MAFESLSEKLQNVFKNLRGKGRLTEADVKAALKEVKIALLEADVNFKVVKNFVKSVQERAIGQDVMNGLNPGQMVIKIVNEELVSLIDAGSGGGIGWALVEDITHAEVKNEKIIDKRYYHTIKEVKNGEGPHPLKTSSGWLHLAHGVRGCYSS